MQFQQMTKQETCSGVRGWGLGLRSCLLASLISMLLISSLSDASTELSSTASEASGAKSYAPPSDRLNAVSLEVGGRAGSYSVNYDRVLEDHLSAGLGVSTFSISDNGGANSSSTQQIALPIYINAYSGWAQHRGYLTAGTNLSSTSYRPSGYGFSPSSGAGVYAILGAGYEYRGTKALLFRVAAYSLANRFSVWLGGSLGYSF